MFARHHVRLSKRKTKTTWFGEAVTVFKPEHWCEAPMTGLLIRSRGPGYLQDILGFSTGWLEIAILCFHREQPSNQGAGVAPLTAVDLIHGAFGRRGSCRQEGVPLLL